MTVSNRRDLLLGAALLVIGAACSLGMRGPVAPESPLGIGESFPESWFYIDRKTGKRYTQPQKIEGKKMPELKIKDWRGGEAEAADLENLAGKVVVVDFWATWCPPCVKSLPKNAELSKKYENDKVLFIGVHDSRRGIERIDAVAGKAGVNYPTGVDDGGVSAKAWQVAFWPTYAVIDHEGVVRAAGLKPTHVEDVIKALVADRDAAADA